MMRQTAAVAAGLICALCGFRTAAMLRQRAQDLTRWTELLTHFALLIEGEALPLPQVMHIAADGADAPDMLLKAVADAMDADPLLTPAGAFSARCPSGPEKDTLQRMFSRIGRGDAACRALAVRQSAEVLARLAGNARKRADTDMKLYRTLGCTAGACLTLLLL